MKSSKSVRSVKSIRSMRSLRSGRDDRRGETGMQSFENMLDVACAKFQCPYTVIVKKETNRDAYYKALMRKDSKGSRHKRMSFISQVSEKSSNTPISVASASLTIDNDKSPVQSNTMIVTMIYDKFNTLTEIVITNRKDVPRILLKIIRLLAPFYQNLTRITVSKCNINMYTIYELSKMLKESTIRNVCLNGSTPLGDFTMLLNTTHLTSLSLCRCNINDHDCELIASKLHVSAPAENLLILDLTTNRITDVGAKYIADSLRTNIRLRYLNLSDNLIQDEGAGYIFDVLMPFPLTCNEIMDMKRRRLDYFKLKNDLYLKCLSDCGDHSYDEISHSSASRKKRGKSISKKEKDKLSESVNEENLKAKAEMMTIDILGHFQDPYHPDSVKLENNYYHCLGNVALQYLNLAYNNLSYISIKKLCDVVKYQNSRKLGNRGLTKVVVDGNNLPITCVEMDIIKEILGKKIMRYSGRISEIVRRKSRNLKKENEDLNKG